MSSETHIKIVANDNDTPQRNARGDAVGFRALLIQNQRERLQQNSAQHTEHVASYNDLFFWQSVALWALIGILCVWCYWTGQPIGPRLISATALVIAGLSLAYFAQRAGKHSFSEIGIFTSLSGFSILMMTAITQLGFPLSLEQSVCTLIICAILVSMLNSSLMALIISVCASYLWAALQLDGYLAYSPLILLMPSIICFQILLAVRFKSSLVILACVFMGYVWIIGSSISFYQAGQITPHYLLSGVAILGLMHMQIAKAAAPRGVMSLELHVFIGWVVFCAGLIGLTRWGLNSLSDSALLDTPNVALSFVGQSTEPQNTSAMLRLIWLAFMATALSVIFVSTLLRRKYRDRYVAAALFTTLTAATLPLFIWFEPKISSYFSEQPSMSLYPLIGFVCAGFTFSLACRFSVKGLQDRRYYYTFTGLVAIAIISQISIHFVFANTGYLSQFATGLAIGFGIMAILQGFASTPQGVRRARSTTQTANLLQASQRGT